MARPIGELSDQRRRLVLANPRSRRLAAMSSRSMTLVARTEPTRGSAFKTSMTLAWAIDVVRLGKVEHLGKAALAGRRVLLDLGATASSLGCGMACLLTLLVAQRGNRHSSRPRLQAVAPIGAISRRLENLPPTRGQLLISPSIRVAAACGPAAGSVRPT